MRVILTKSEGRERRGGLMWLTHGILQHLLDTMWVDIIGDIKREHFICIMHLSSFLTFLQESQSIFLALISGNNSDNKCTGFFSASQYLNQAITLQHLQYLCLKYSNLSRQTSPWKHWYYILPLTTTQKSDSWPDSKAASEQQFVLSLPSKISLAMFESSSCFCFACLAPESFLQDTGKEDACSVWLIVSATALTVGFWILARGNHLQWE